MTDETKPAKAPAKIDPVAKSFPIVAKVRGKLFSQQLWKNTLPVYKCEQCGAFRNDKEQLFDHILLHYKASEQEEILDSLLKE